MGLYPSSHPYRLWECIKDGYGRKNLKSKNESNFGQKVFVYIQMI